MPSLLREILDLLSNEREYRIKDFGIYVYMPLSKFLNEDISTIKNEINYSTPKEKGTWNKSPWVTPYIKESLRSKVINKLCLLLQEEIEKMKNEKTFDESKSLHESFQALLFLENSNQNINYISEWLDFHSLKKDREEIERNYPNSREILHYPNLLSKVEIPCLEEIYNEFINKLKEMSYDLLLSELKARDDLTILKQIIKLISDKTSGFSEFNKDQVPKFLIKFGIKKSDQISLPNILLNNIEQIIKNSILNEFFILNKKSSPEKIVDLLLHNGRINEIYIMDPYFGKCASDSKEPLGKQEYWNNLINLIEEADRAIIICKKHDKEEGRAKPIQRAEKINKLLSSQNVVVKYINNIHDRIIILKRRNEEECWILGNSLHYFFLDKVDKPGYAIRIRNEENIRIFKNIFK